MAAGGIENEEAGGEEEMIGVEAIINCGKIEIILIIGLANFVEPILNFYFNKYV